MRLPYDLLTQNYVKPQLYLCETDKTRICALDTIDLSGSFKFNAYSELNFTLSRTYTNMITGETQVNPFYDKVEALRLVYLEGFGYFEIQDPEITSDGIREVKSVTAYSLEYRLSQKYLENFKINTGDADSVEVIKANGSNEVIPVRLHYNHNNFKDLSLTHLVLEKIYDWSWGHIDDSLKTMSRQFDVSRASIYDFITQDLCEKFNCYAEFNTIENKINLYAEAFVSKHIGDDKTTKFKLSFPYSSIGSVTIDGYKTTEYSYQIVQNQITQEKAGWLTFEKAPPDNAKIEVTDGSQEKFRTDVYVSFDNLAQECNVSYSAEDIKTVLTIKGAEDLDIREVNMGIPYITDLSYYHTEDWMGKDLCDAYTVYMHKINSKQQEYEDNSEKMIEIAGRIAYETNRLSLQYSETDSITSTTVGTYYVRCGTEESSYYYKEVQLPDEYNANVQYYMLSGADLNEKKFNKLYAVLQTYFVSDDKSEGIKDLEDDKLKESFSFVEDDLNDLIASLKSATSLDQEDKAILKFFSVIFYQLGKLPLEELYLKPYQEIKETNEDAKWDKPDNENYGRYYPVTLVIKAVETAIEDRKATIDEYQQEYDFWKDKNSDIAKDTSMYNGNNFTHDQLVRLSPFLREDEYTDDNFVETDSDTIEKLIQTKHELLECGKIELKKLCEPKLEFSMDMANIYALIEFEPIIDQFQLGNFINVVIRSDYIKKARLLQVDINFHDFSDFKCEFGELTSLKTQSSIHADLLANAIAAGNSVASNQSYWNKGADLATSTDLAIHNGLLDAIGAIYNSDQSVRIDNNGILLRQVMDNGEYSQYQIRLRNNQLLVSTDAFNTSQTGIGVFTVNGQELYGVLAKAILSGYIEGSTIVGGTININDKFIVDSKGNVTMKAASINGYVEEDNVISSINQSPEKIAINANKISLAGKKIDLTSDNITIDSTNFSVTKDGKITATSGEIAGWSIYDNYLRKTTTIDNVTYQMFIQAADGADGADTTSAFAIRRKHVDDTSWDNQFYVSYTGKLVAKNANITGSITAKEGSIAGYNIGSGGSYSNAIYKRVSSSSTDYEVGLKASDGDTDLAFYVKKSTDNWKNSSNVFYVNNSGKLYAQNADITGKINASSGVIGSWTVGDMGNYTDSIYSTYCAASSPSSSNPEYAVFMRGKGAENTIAIGIKKRTSSATSWNDSENPFYVRKDGYVVMNNANVTGTVNATAGNIGGCSIKDGVLNVSAANITSGTIATARIPSLSADKITTGVLNAGRIPNISADKITSGTISASRLDSSVITTGNFSSKTLSTTNLTIASGCRLGVASEYNAKLYSSDGYTWMEAFTPSSSYISSMMNIVRAGVNVASSKDIKSEIHDFDERYDAFFDKLNPQLFKYDFELDMGYSMGFIWEDARSSMDECGITENDLGAIHESEGTIGGKVFRKDDFVALNTWQIQKLKSRIEELENKLEALERNDTK